MTNVNDEGLVQQRLSEIDSINLRAMEAKKGLIQQRRTSQGVAPADLAPVLAGTIEHPYDLSGGQSRQAIPQAAFYRDPWGNVRRNDNGDSGNPKFNPKTRAQIEDATKPRPVDRYRANPSAPRKGKMLVYNPQTGELE